MKRQIRVILKWFWATLFHQCVAVCTVYTLWVPIKHYTFPFSWHIILCTIGVLPLLATSFISFWHRNVPSQDVEKDGKRWLHPILAFTSLIFVMIGVALEIDRKEKVIIDHFASTHAILGLISVIFLILASLGGFLIFLPPIFRERIQPLWLKVIHNVIGQIGYFMGLGCLIFGYWQDYFVFYMSKKSNIGATLLTIIIGAWSLFYSCRSISNYIKRARS